MSIIMKDKNILNDLEYHNVLLKQIIFQALFELLVSTRKVKCSGIDIVIVYMFVTWEVATKFEVYSRMVRAIECFITENTSGVAVM